MAKLEEERDSAVNELSVLEREFESLRDGYEDILEEKAGLLIQLKKNKLEMEEVEEENKKLNKKLNNSENLIFQLRQEIEENKEKYEQEIKVKFS
ncbi:unnamed protein product [Meloidogyne enterolobii]|uniref:Uncharacterized protein n=1 Tax=Meloidogyne enterolobii TaxID=390850 RepID=A0ACB0Z4Q0_MELEN